MGIGSLADDRYKMAELSSGEERIVDLVLFISQPPLTFSC